MAAVGAAGTRKTVGEDAACEVAAEFPFDRRWGAAPGPVILQCSQVARCACCTVR